MVLRWLLTKVGGVDQSCRDNVVVFLTKHSIEKPSFEFVTGEQTYTHFHVRVYFGRGIREQQWVSFLLKVDENLGSVSSAAIVKDASKEKIRTFQREWSQSELRAFGLYSHLVHSLGKIEDLDYLG